MIKTTILKELVIWKKIRPGNFYMMIRVFHEQEILYTHLKKNSQFLILGIMYRIKKQCSNKNVTLKKPRPNNDRPSKPVFGSESSVPTDTYYLL
ncbi:hypothetical protein BpHYR1_030265 [Brachionus plicatilis]|uniref:Uncharacterized protein n=1 Tax=Brachionus plicatilis TaxID=10195 RepID=A0A3M7RV99_BRAPC|nr:hypothetical protein BpHYR1_030265 [Brachionus plicatilis]